MIYLLSTMLSSLGVIAFIFVISMTVFYYCIVIADLNNGEYKSKKHFFKSFIPYYKWAKPLIDKFNKLDGK